MTAQRLEYQMHGRAVGHVQRRASGWWQWICLTTLGERVGPSGMEKSKERARDCAGKAARTYNTNLLRK